MALYSVKVPKKHRCLSVTFSYFIIDKAGLHKVQSLKIPFDGTHETKAMTGSVDRLERAERERLV